MDNFTEKINILNEELLTEEEKQWRNPVDWFFDKIIKLAGLPMKVYHVYYLKGGDTTLPKLEKALNYNHNENIIKAPKDALLEQEKNAIKQANAQQNLLIQFNDPTKGVKSTAEIDAQELAVKLALKVVTDIEEKLEIYINPFTDDGAFRPDPTPTGTTSTKQAQAVLAVNLADAFSLAITEQNRYYIRLPELMKGVLRGRENYVSSLKKTRKVRGYPNAHKTLMHFLSTYNGGQAGRMIAYLTQEQADSKQKKEQGPSSARKILSGLYDTFSQI